MNLTNFFALILLSSTIAIASASPAHAITCDSLPTATSTATSTDNVTCYRVQARIDRYIGGSVTSYFGPMSTGTSVASNGSGTNAGNAHRKSLYGTGETWSAWKWL